jgi:uncharacterized membrane protein YagU involved in acid resistance
VVLLLSHASVAVNVTVAAPVAPHPSLNPSKSLVHVTLPEHISVALDPAWFANHAPNADWLPAPSHSTVVSRAGDVIVGGVVSTIVNVAAVVLLLPQASVAVNITVAAPVAPQPSLNPSKLFVHVTLSEQISLALDPAWLSNHTDKASWFPCPSHSTVVSRAGESIVGGVVSTIVNVAAVVLLLPQASVAVNITVAAPVAPHRSLNAVKLFVQVTLPEQISLALDPAWLVNHAANATRLLAPSHSTVVSRAGASIVGGVVSTIVNVADVVLLLPQSSVAVNITVAAPVAPHPSLNPSKLFFQFTLPEQISLALDPAWFVNHAVNAA